MTEVGELSDSDREVLSFERLRWKYAGAKELAVRETFGMSLTRYYQVLESLIDRPEALAADPPLVRRLLRLREARRRQRAAVIATFDEGYGVGQDVGQPATGPGL